MDGIKVDPAMVQLATQLVQRQSGKYDASDLEDRYETRLRALIEAKLKGEGLDAAEEPQIATGNVVDLMAALKKSLGHQPDEKPGKTPRKKAAAKKQAAAQAASKPSRKRARAGSSTQQWRRMRRPRSSRQMTQWISVSAMEPIS
jgi:DNA end-binding protein Ku